LKAASSPVQIPDTPVRDGGVSRRFFSNTILNYGGQAFIILLTFLTVPYTVHHLGPELFGIVALVQVTAGLAGLVNLGIGRALTKYVSELYWKRDFQGINELFRTAWATSLIAGLFGLILLIAPKEQIVRVFFRGGPEISTVTYFAVYVAAFGLFSSILLETVSALPTALQRFGIYNAINVAVGAMRAVGPVVVLAAGYSIKAVLIVILASNFLAVGAFAATACIFIPGLSLVPTFSWPTFKKLFRFSLPLLLSALFTLVISRVDRFILAYYMPLASVTFFTLPYSISEKAYAGVTNITSVVLPFTSELHSIGVRDRLHKLYLQATKTMTIVSLPFTVILIALPTPILRLWVGSEYAEQGSTVLMVLAAATLLNAISGVATATSLGVGRVWQPAAFAFGASAISLASNVALIPLYGINGAAFSFLLPQLIVAPLFVYVVTRTLAFPMLELLHYGFVRPIICASIQFLVLFFCREYVTSILALGLLCLASLCLYGLLSVFVAITSREREILFRTITSGVRKRSRNVLRNC